MQPFNGLKVIDLSPNRVGAQVSQIFADFGADVIQIEPPEGAAIRGHAAYPFWGRGKRSIALDINDPNDRSTIKQLAQSADVFIETFAPGELDAIGLGFDDVSASNTHLIYTSITGFGRQGPYANAPGYEGIVHAKVGAFQAFKRMSSESAPPYLSVPFAAFAASQTAIHGTLAALIDRDNTGMGQRVDANLLQGFMTLDTWSWFEFLIAHRWPDAFTATSPYDEAGRPASPLTFMLLVCLTKDGKWLQFAAVAPHLFAAKMKALGLGWMFTDPDWKGLPMFDSAEKRDELWTKMLEGARSKTLAEWEAIFAEDDNVFAEQFRKNNMILNHPQLGHDKMVLSLNDLQVGPVRQPGAIVKAANTPAQLDRSAPTFDQDRAAILAQLADSEASTVTATTASEAAAASFSERLPLEGVTILELATLFAAPHGTTMLTDLGARVFKIEPLAGDRIRNIIPFPESGGAKVMQGKDSVCIDLTTPEGLAIVRELAAKSDVVVQGYRAGAMSRAGLDYESIKALNPNVIYVNAPGYGVDGPYGSKPAYAPSIGAAAGLPLANVGDSVPERDDLTIEQIKDGARRLSAASAISNAQADGFAALGVATAILFGLAARSRGAGGQELFSSMINTGAHAMSAQAVTYDNAPVEPTVDSQFRGLSPLYRVYDASSGYVFLAAPSDTDWARFVEAVRPSFNGATDPRFATASARESNADALTAALSELFSTKSDTEWETELLRQGVGCVKVATSTVESMMFDDAFGRASGYVADVTHPTFDEHPRLAPFVRFSRSRTQAKPGVLAGDQTDQVLAELGRSAADIADLRDRKVVG